MPLRRMNALIGAQVQGAPLVHVGPRRRVAAHERRRVRTNIGWAGEARGPNAKGAVRPEVVFVCAGVASA